jgi:hypothetical protein
MFNIDNVQESPYNYKFPTIDCKFQNTGNATAFLWQFAVNVIQAEIDFTPIPDFSYSLRNNALEIDVTNNGWGAMRDFQITIDQPIINRLFLDSVRQYQENIDSGKSQTVFSLSKENADNNNFEAISKEFEKLDILLPKGTLIFDSKTGDLSLSELRKKSIYGIKLKPLRINWNWKNKKNIKHTGENTIRLDDIILTQAGFNWLYSGLYSESEIILWPIPQKVFGSFFSDVTYSTIIDPSKGSHKRVYPISRTIPSGDVERFHIMVCSPMSCYLRLQFEFFVDQLKVVQSEVFDINIWNPRNSGWHKAYKDGVELSRQLDKV